MAGGRRTYDGARRRRGVSDDHGHRFNGANGAYARRNIAIRRIDIYNRMAKAHKPEHLT